MTKILSYLISATVILTSLSACDNKTKNIQLKAADAITIINPRIRALPPRNDYGFKTRFKIR